MADRLVAGCFFFETGCFFSFLLCVKFSDDLENHGYYRVQTTHCADEGRIDIRLEMAMGTRNPKPDGFLPH
jgi:hypothetical protein